MVRIDKGPMLGRRSNGPVAIDGRSRRGRPLLLLGAATTPAEAGPPAARMAGTRRHAPTPPSSWASTTWRGDSTMAAGGWNLSFALAARRRNWTGTSRCFRSDAAATGLAPLSFLRRRADDHTGGWLLRRPWCSGPCAFSLQHQKAERRSLSAAGRPLDRERLMALQPRHRHHRAVRSLWHDRRRSTCATRPRRRSTSSSPRRDPQLRRLALCAAVSAPTRRSPAGS